MEFITSELHLKEPILQMGKNQCMIATLESLTGTKTQIIVQQGKIANTGGDQNKPKR